MKRIYRSAMQEGMASCHTCLRLTKATTHVCPRCGAALHVRKEHSIEKTIAFGIAGILAFIPANLLPIMVVTHLGVDERTTIIGGVATFWEMHAYPVAIIIFIASVMIPALKFIALGILVSAAKGKLVIDARRANTIYWLTELVGRWSMVDVFVVAILVGLIRMGNLMTINPGGAALAFGLMVILTMLSAHSFDPRLIWDRLRETRSNKHS